MESEEFKDDLIRDIVKTGARTLPNVNFEDQMMLAIQAEVDYKQKVAAQLKTSLRFFLVALLSGVILTLVILFDATLGEYINILTVLTLFLIIVFGVLNINNYRRLIRKYSWS